MKRVTREFYIFPDSGGFDVGVELTLQHGVDVKTCIFFNTPHSLTKHGSQAQWPVPIRRNPARTAHGQMSWRGVRVSGTS